MVTQGGKVVWAKYAQVTNHPENDGCINAILLIWQTSRSDWSIANNKFFIFILLCLLLFNCSVLNCYKVLNKLTNICFTVSKYIIFQHTPISCYAALEIGSRYTTILVWMRFNVCCSSSIQNYSFASNRSDFFISGSRRSKSGWLFWC